MKSQNNESFHQGHLNMPVYQQIEDDEIDLRELIKVIWDYKWLTAVMCVLAIVGSVFYALNAQEWWVAKGKVIQPQLNDVAELYSQTERVKAVLKAGELKGELDNGEANIPVSFSNLFEPHVLFANFINTFNSSINKKEFLESNPVFLAFLKYHKIELPTNETTAENQLVRQTYQTTLNGWLQEINASQDPKTKEATLSFRTDGKHSSSDLLNKYIDFIANKVKENQLEKFSLFVDSSQNELEVAIAMSEARVKLELQVLLKKTELAYKIASQSGMNDYKPNLNVEEDLFQINLGAKALKSKVEVLKSIKDLSILDPNIAKMKITLNTLKDLHNVNNQSFTPYRYLENVEPPLNRAAPKRALIVVLATLLAGMVSIFIALVHFYMVRKPVIKQES
ncbi:chain length determinant-like protein [Psychromonas sp. RZ22]|uniref:Wzz/FepE/Etk N-terminal domain-containing protein n=1 Tax=Psychromonas algarum TaxID=2555643 RepID=UPI001067FBBD|nr:Wzz/FepE/Etk N-terminal domain-containing protein [Psychromonas sp. RZ22]TEW56486.1 chain length determinant-like protein [Psychromonas sp. RZ22]